MKLGKMNVEACVMGVFGSCLTITMPTGQVVQVWESSARDSRPLIQIWATEEKHGRCEEPDQEISF